jgi:hypothetical protein
MPTCDQTTYRLRESKFESAGETLEGGESNIEDIIDICDVFRRVK